jgi:5S rRNA maturation endonuclease (ribonuclease M5)
VGRPSCLGGQKLLVELLQSEHVCILADSDGPGQTGAQKLAEALQGKSKSVSVATPPAKDLREWKYQGCQRIDVLNLIRGAATSPDTI